METVGASSTVIEIGLDVVLAPPLSVATAESEYFPAGTWDHVTVNGAEVAVAIRVPPWKNSTCVTVPSGSEALAVSVIVAGAMKIEPVGGLVIVTTGGWFMGPLGGITVIETGSERVDIPPLSVATAVRL